MKDWEIQQRIQLYLEGEDAHAYKWLGCHKEGDRHIFRVWAPHARRVWVTGEENDWQEQKAQPMKKIHEEGFFEACLWHTKTYDAYKYQIETREGKILYKADPYAFHAETRPYTASKVYDAEYHWQDEEWIKWREHQNFAREPINIYEMHLGCFKRQEDGSYYGYRDLIRPLIAYIRQMGYTHVQFMPVMEHPYDASWGYQVTGYFAPTSRYGTPEDFSALVDALHRAGVGVLLDWVPAHFPKDECGLFQFDGAPCYEYDDPMRAEHPDWGTMIFDYQKGAVRSFLLSSALFWIEHYHADGLRVDAVASMLYLDYGRAAGQWRPNHRGGRENLEAISFLKQLTRTVRKAQPGVLLMAEESTAFPNVTNERGLNFHFKWNMGWMNDTLYYMQKDPLFRAGEQSALTFSLSYAFSEQFVLPLSHDEVVHGKKALVDKMPGAYEQRFANLRAYIAYMYAHPGKKLIFMGDEIAQFDEWSEKKPLDFDLLRFPKHKGYHEFSMSLNHLYRKMPPLWVCDDSEEGFSWISADNARQNVLAFARFDEVGNTLIAVCHFGGENLSDYQIGVPYGGVYEEKLNTDAELFGGAGRVNGKVRARKKPMHGQEYSIALHLPPFTTLYCYKKAPARRAKRKDQNKGETA